MNVVLWIVQVLLAVAFLIVGGMKLGMPPEDLVANGFTFADDLPLGLVRFIGLVEIAGAIGLLLPSMLRVQPKLTVVSAASLAFLMLLGVITYLWLGNAAMLWAPLVLGLLSAFVAWGRSSRAEIVQRPPQPIEPTGIPRGTHPMP